MGIWARKGERKRIIGSEMATDMEIVLGGGGDVDGASFHQVAAAHTKSANSKSVYI